MQQIKYRLSKLVLKLVWIILKYTKIIYYLYIYYIFATYSLIHILQVIIDNGENIFHVQSGFLSHEKGRKLLSPNRFHWTRRTSEISCCYILGDCIYSNGDPVITPYKVTDIIRQPRAIKRARRKFNMLLQRRRIFVGN